MHNLLNNIKLLFGKTVFVVCHISRFRLATLSTETQKKYAQFLYIIIFKAINRIKAGVDFYLDKQ